MSQITDVQRYNEQMSHSMADKLFFLNEIDRDSFDTIVDFGCANGELLKLMPNKYLKIGIDNSDIMIQEAKKNFPQGVYMKSLEDVKCFDLSNALLNMSSVIHEVYSYLTPEEIHKFWDNVFNSGYKYITIRDMMVSVNTNRDMNLDEMRVLIKNPEYRALYSDFHKSFPKWRLRDMLHFLMKYRYTENWERERDENYFPITVEELLALIPSNYELIMGHSYVLKWVRFKVYKDFGYDIQDNTHTQIILKRKD